MTPRPFAAFDIDGTVMRWQLYHALADQFVHMGFLSREQFAQAREARMTWKRRAHENSFLEYEDALIRVVQQTMVGMKISDFEDSCGAVMDEYKDQVYTYTRNLIEDLRQRNYLLFAVSASQAQIVQQFAEYYGFDGYGGSEYEVQDGRLTGKLTYLMKGDNKSDFLHQLAAEHTAGWQGSIAVGDSESDIPMLASVEQAVAFNPTKALFTHAQTEGWKVVVERKNMVYELEPSNGSYLLARTDGQ